LPGSLARFASSARLISLLSNSAREGNVPDSARRSSSKASSNSGSIWKVVLIFFASLRGPKSNLWKRELLNLIEGTAAPRLDEAKAADKQALH
jgi:hypothetical protein